MVAPQSVRETARVPLKPRDCLALVLAALLALACAPREVRPGEYRAWVNGFGYGLVGSRALDVRDVCASGGAERVEVRQTAGTVAASALSLGLYTPRQVRIHCRR
jgi:hypothetical protein